MKVKRAEARPIEPMGVVAIKISGPVAAASAYEVS